MNLDKIIKYVIRETLINEGRKPKERLDEFNDGKRIYDIATKLHPTIKELARPNYGVRQQKDNVEKLYTFFRNNRPYIDKVADKYNKIKKSEGSGPFEIGDIVRTFYSYCEIIVRRSNDPNNQLDGAESFLRFYPEEIKEWDESQKQEIEEYAKTIGGGSMNFFKNLIYDKDMDLIDIRSNMDFIFELKDKYGVNLFILPIGW
jgi:hypothetical protein